MKKIIAIALLCAAVCGMAYADSLPTEQDYKNLAELREKLVRMKREMDKFIKDIITTYPDQPSGNVDLFGQDVKVDVAETDKDIIVKADLPGMDKDKIDITLANNRILKIAGSREMSKEETSPGVVKKERMSGHFERTLELPADCMNEGIKATYKNGVLEIIIPKRKAAKAEEIKVKVQ